MPYGIDKKKGGEKYANVVKMHSCVNKVMKTGKSKESAIRICKSQLFK